MHSSAGMGSNPRDEGDTQPWKKYKKERRERERMEQGGKVSHFKRHFSNTIGNYVV